MHNHLRFTLRILPLMYNHLRFTLRILPLMRNCLCLKHTLPTLTIGCEA